MTQVVNAKMTESGTLWPLSCQEETETWCRILDLEKHSDAVVIISHWLLFFTAGIFPDWLTYPIHMCLPSR